MALKDWSTTAGNNDDADAAINWAENQAPSTVNNSARAMMAVIRTWYDDLEWRDLGHTVTYASATTFTISGDVTANYPTDRPIRCTDSSTLYGVIASSSYGAPNTTVTVTLDSGSLSGSLSAVSLGFTPTNKPLHVSSVRDAFDVGGNNTSTGNNTFSHTTSGSTPITITSTNADATAGPILDLLRDSASPAASDQIALIRLRGKNSTDTLTNYVTWRGVIDDPTNGSEDSSCYWQTWIAGTQTQVMTLGPGLQLGSPTGGDKGSGTINATALYDDGDQIIGGSAITQKIDADTSSNYLQNSAAETTVYTGTFTGGQLGTTRAIRITLIGIAADTATGASTLTLRVKYGGTTFSTLVLEHASSGSGKPVYMQSILSAANSASAQECVTFGTLNNEDYETVTASGTIDSTSNQTLAVTAQMSAASPNLTFNIYAVHVELI